jgi:hypothetical protein
MIKRMFRICTMLVIGLATSQTILSAQQSSLIGVWSVTVTVTDCQSGALIRTVHSLQLFSRDGSITETANTASRGPSEGVWTNAGGQTYNDTFWFYRYNPDGTFKSLAKGMDTIALGQDGEFTSVGTVQDFDANGNSISIACVTHSAVRLSDGNGN